MPSSDFGRLADLGRWMAIQERCRDVTLFRDRSSVMA
jgi:hypothetical protein